MWKAGGGLVGECRFMKNPDSVRHLLQRCAASKQAPACAMQGRGAYTQKLKVSNAVTSRS